MACPPEDSKASDAGGMANEKESDTRKRKPTVEPCPADCSHEGEDDGGDVKNEPELQLVASPSSPLLVSVPIGRLSSAPVVSPSSPRPASAPASWLPTSPFGSPPSPLVVCGPRSRRRPSPSASSEPSSYQIVGYSSRKLLNFFDSDPMSISLPSDLYVPLESLEEVDPEISQGGVQRTEEAIVDDEKDAIPYIGDVEPLSSLADEYRSGTSIFQKKIELLREKYRGIRRVKRDGNCFYRSFMFAYLEYLLESQNDAEMERVLATVERLRERLLELGRHPILVATLCDVFILTVRTIRQGKLNQMELLESCRKDASDNLVRFHRLVTACEMCRRKDHYEPFVVGLSDISVEEYCRRSVEPLGEENENMEIRALSDALEVPLRLENLDQSLTDGVPALVGLHFQPNNDTGDDVQQPPFFTLLYRPGHYDILYPI